MTPRSESHFVTRRVILQVLTSVPALALVHRALPSNRVPAPKLDGLVEVNGWILKRSEVA